MFKLDLGANVSMTSLKGTFTATFPQMIEKFGPGAEGVDKVSKEWVFTDEHNNVFTVYDWKSTRLYDPGYPEPADLWASKDPYEFHVGGRTCCDSFVNWIAGELGVGDGQVTFVVEWTEKHRTRIRASSGASALDTFLEMGDLQEEHDYPSLTFCEVVNIDLINETHKIKEGFLLDPSLPEPQDSTGTTEAE